jgi:hypothetical protein
MKTTIAIIFLLADFYCIGQDYLTPNGFEKIEEKFGDLDKDGVPEKVIVYNTTDTMEFGVVRELQILKKSGKKWIIWKKSKNAVLKSQEGGMMGNPFEGVEIEKGILIINLSGGSSWKWSRNDKYRLQNNEFRLIGCTVSYGKPCEYWMNFDFNLFTGKIEYQKEYESCNDGEGQKIYKTETETFYKKEVLYNLNNRYLKETKIITPKYKEELYL